MWTGEPGARGYKQEPVTKPTHMLGWVPLAGQMKWEASGSHVRSCSPELPLVTVSVPSYVVVGKFCPILNYFVHWFLYP